MRIPIIAAMLLVTSSAIHAQERTWTIATAVDTVEAELLSIRGDVVYLKIGDKIDSVPLARLSAADHQFIASLSLAPVRPGNLPVIERSVVSPTPLAEEVLPPGPTLIPATTEEALPAPPQPAAVLPVPTGGAARGGVTQASGTNSARGTATNRGGSSTGARRSGATNVRRGGSTSNQLQNGQSNNSNSGLLGIRERRADRQRGR